MKCPRCRAGVLRAIRSYVVTESFRTQERRCGACSYVVTYIVQTEVVEVSDGRSAYVVAQDEQERRNKKALRLSHKS